MQHALFSPSVFADTRAVAPDAIDVQASAESWQAGTRRYRQAQQPSEGVQGLIDIATKRIEAGDYTTWISALRAGLRNVKPHSRTAVILPYTVWCVLAGHPEANTPRRKLNPDERLRMAFHWYAVAAGEA